jgi:CHASE2 domain-containing sensor protein
MAPSHKPARSHKATHHPQGWHARLRPALLGLLYLCALCLLAAWEYRDRFEAFSSSCEPIDHPVESGLYARPYNAVLRWATADTAPHVVLLAIPAELEDIQSNVCLGRSYMADVLRTLAAEHPAVVVIDKFYSTTACAKEPEVTRELSEAIGSVGAPVAIAESTGTLAEKTGGACLVRKPHLTFSSPNVYHGIARFDTEKEHLPVQWSILPAGFNKDHPDAQAGDSLAWTAVQLYDGSYAKRPRVQALLHDRESYANVSIDLPRMTTTMLLCRSGKADVRKRWDVACQGAAAQPNLLGKIVVIGAEDTSDVFPVLDGHKYGFELNARYMEALLSGTYLRGLSPTAILLVFALFIFLIEGLPTLLAFARPRWKHKRFLRHAYQRRRYFWVSFWTVAFILGTGVLSLAFHFLPPLVVFGDILLVAISRLLIFAAESTEHPLIHSTGRHIHTMSEPTPYFDAPGGEGGTKGNPFPPPPPPPPPPPETDPPDPPDGQPDGGAS